MEVEKTFKIIQGSFSCFAFALCKTSLNLVATKGLSHNLNISFFPLEP